MSDKVTPFKKQKPDYAALLKPSELMQTPPPSDAPTPERYRQLGIDEVDVYENNPRTTEHGEYESIKAAFMTGGIDTVMLQVTRRPGSDRYVLAFGANTRLKIIKELWSETGDKRFEAVRCIEVPWGGEIWLQTNHLIENTNRNDMCFWDTAKAFCDLHAKLEAAHGSEISQREFIERANKLGSIISRTAYGFYSFAVLTFHNCRCKMTLSRGIVEQIKPRFSFYEHIARLAQKPIESGIAGAIERFDGERFDMKQLLICTDSAVAEKLDMSPTQFAGVLGILKTEPKATWERVLQRLEWRDKATAKPVQTAQAPSQENNAVANVATQAFCPEPPIAFGAPARFAHRLDASAAAKTPAAFWDSNYPDADRLDAAAQVDAIWQLASFICIDSRMPGVLKRHDEGVGFFVEPDPTITNPNARQLWALLAMLSGQYYPGIYKRLPTESVWGRMLKGEQPDCLSWLETAVEPPQVAFGRMVYGYAPYGTPSWINYADRSVAVGAPSAAYAKLMVACLELLEGAPERFAQISTSPDGTPKTIGNGLKPPLSSNALA